MSYTLPEIPGDTPLRMAARVQALHMLGAWAEPHARLPQVDDLRRLLASLVTGHEPGIADAVYDVVLGLMAGEQLPDEQRVHLVEPAINVFTAMRARLVPPDPPAHVDPPLPISRPRRQEATDG